MTVSNAPSVDDKQQPRSQQIPWYWLPALLTAAVTLYYHLDVPYFDQWDLLPLLDAYYQQRLQGEMLFAAHNGHILLLPRIIMLSLALLTHWNTLAEVIVGFACATTNCWLLIKIAQRMQVRTLNRVDKCVIVCFAFSLTQAQNWLWGWQLQVPLALMWVLLGFYCLLTVRSHFFATLMACIFAVAASFSFAGGLPFWLAALPLLYQRKPIAALVWLLLSLLFSVTYLAMTHTHDNNPQALLQVDTPFLLSVAKNTIACFGTLLARFHNTAAILAGIGGIVLFGYHYSHQKLPLQKSLLLSLFLFAMGNALLIAVGRSAFSSTEQLLSSRYSSLTLPFWAVIAVLQMQTSQASIRRYRIFQKGIFTLLAISLFIASIYSLKDFQQIHARQLKGIMAMTDATGANDHYLPAINPRQDQAQARKEVEMLKHYQLSYFRKP